MLFLLCLICVSYSYASENVPLLPLKYEKLYAQVKASYDLKSPLPYNVCESQITKIYFYDPIKKEPCFFQPVNHAIENLFQKSNLPIFDIVSSSDMITFRDNNNLDIELFDRFICFFKQVSNWYSYACIPKNRWHERWVYNLQHFLYAITSTKEASNQKDTYNHFFTCFQQEANNFYDDIAQERKYNLVWLGGVTGIGLSGLMLWFTALQTNFTMSNLDFGAKLCGANAGIMPTICLSFTIQSYLFNYFGYQAFLKNIETINQELGIKGV
jgi:hypothetical protein